ncbi:MAG: hypothetical protein A3K19_29985 [Lentisphaerae bacterium RIFOXYB12_FULL_65_16]|nr:MAG: hypothetical protein A3K18_33595 [Lentisphaerae bacterium RIFOXYA12_64_32]OGV86555.1 MAG: hypothetical protein A3K19_29985 [Lentisphaerae bacterium RIFOXYB12_FULL_65_16]
MSHTTPQPASATRPISATFLDFATPLLRALSPQASKDDAEAALKIAFTVWNFVVLDVLHGNHEYVAMIRQSTAGEPASAAVVEQMIARKQALFADDHRLLGKYSLTRKHGEWRLRVEEGTAR